MSTYPRPLRIARLAMAAIALAATLYALAVLGRASGAPASTPPYPSASPVISGTVARGQPLTASTGTWSGSPAVADPAGFSYQWQQCSPQAPVSSTFGSIPGTFPEFVALDSTGNVFTGNRDTDNISKLTPGAVAINSVGTTVTSPFTWAAAGDGPFGMTMDSAGNVYVANRNSTFITKADVQGSVTNLDSGDATTYQDVAVDSRGYVYAVSWNSDTVTRFAPGATSPDATFTAAGGVALVNPFGMAFDASDNLYVADTGNDRVVKITTGGATSVFGVTGDGPFDIAVDAGGSVYTTDTPGNRVTKLLPGGSSAGGAWPLAIADPWGVAIGPDGNVYVSRGAFASATGDVFRITPAGASTDIGDTGSWPLGLAFDPVGNVYVASRNGSSITKITTMACSDIAGATNETYTPQASDSQKQLRVKVTGTNGVYPDASAYSALSAVIGPPVTAAPPAVSGTATVSQALTTSNGTWTGNPTGYAYQWQRCDIRAAPSFVGKWGSGGTADGQFNDPVGLGIDRAGNVYVADTVNNRIQKFDASGTFLFAWGASGSGDGQFSNPRGVAIDSDGNVYVADTDNSRVQKFDSSGRFISKWGSQGNGNGQFQYTRGIAIDSADNVYVTDYGNNRVQKFTSIGTYISQWGSTGTGDAQFREPTGIAIDAAGNVYVADYTNNRVQKFTSTGTYTTQWGSTGSGNGQFNGPIGVAVNFAGNVYVSDYTNDRVQVFTPGGTYVSQWGSSGTGDGQFDAPQNVAFGPGKTIVYVVEQLNDRVQAFDTVSCSDIGSATQSAYTVATADVGKYVRTRVTASNLEGSASTTSIPSASVTQAPVNDTAPSISGTEQVGQTLTAAKGSWTATPAIADPAGYSYKWQTSADGVNNWSDISGATNSTYVLQAADYDQYIRVQVTATNGVAPDGTANSPASGVIAGITPANTAVPTVSGTAQVGQTLTAADGTWTGTPTPTYAYKWQTSANGTSGWSDISGATNSTYVLQAADYQQYIRVQVTGTNAVGNATASSTASSQVAGTTPANTAVPTISGTAQVGQTLTAADGTWTGTPTPTYAYKWQTSANGTSGWSDISGATNSTYVLQAADYQQYIRVQVTGTNAVGNATASSTASSQVAGTTPANTAVPTISGTAQVGQTLTAADGTWTGTPTPTYAYKWQTSANGTSGWSDISGATNSTYAITSAEAGYFVRVLVTAANAVGSTSVGSAASSQVPAAPSNTSLPTISGTAQVGQALTADPGEWRAAPAASFTYEWERCGPDGSGCSSLASAGLGLRLGIAAGSTYVLTSADQGATIRVRVTATNGVLPNSSATSAATAVVAAAPVTPSGGSGGNSTPVTPSDGGTARLSVQVLPSRSRVVSGQSLRIGLRTRNTGTATGTRVTSCIRLPSNMAIVQEGSALRSGRTLCFGLGDLPAGAQRTRAITVRAVSARTATRSITATARGRGDARVSAPAKVVTIRPRPARTRVTG